MKITVSIPSLLAMACLSGHAFGQSGVTFDSGTSDAATSIVMNLCDPPGFCSGSSSNPPQVALGTPDSNYTVSSGSDCSLMSGAGAEVITQVDLDVLTNGDQQFFVSARISANEWQPCLQTDEAENEVVLNYIVPCRGDVTIDVLAIADDTFGFCYNDALDGELRLYVNNVLQTTVIASGTPSSASTIFSGELQAQDDIRIEIDVLARMITTSGDFCFDPIVPSMTTSFDGEIEYELACLADTNRDGMLTPADLSAWILAFNTGDPIADQNCDGMLTPADYSAWILNFNAGC